jgi:murein DD-endopeptidase MepM/ murein hydrolase activator NlpD
VFKRIFIFIFAAILLFLFLIRPSTAFSRFPQINGQPQWTQVSFSNLGKIQSDNLGYIDDVSLIQQLGYNPSRAYSIGDDLGSVMKVGDLDIFGIGRKTVGSYLGGANPSNVSLGEFEAINGVTLNDLNSSISSLKNIPVSSFPLLKSIVSGNRSGIAQNLSPFLQQVSPAIKNYLSANPWAADLPVEQLLQGDWKGVALQGTLKVGLPQLVQKFPSLKNIPLGDIVSAVSSGNIKSLANVGIQYGLKQLQGTVGDFLKNNPQLANLPIGMLTDINKLSINSIPGLANTAITAIPGVKNQLIKNVPGLENVPLSTLLGLFTAAIAKVDFPDQGATIAPRALTGGGYSFTSTPCTGPNCSNFEVNQATALNPLISKALNGTQFVVGSNDSKKGQSVKGGKGPLGKLFGGKEPVHIRPWGDDPNISMAVMSVNDVKGDAQLGFYLRVCIENILIPKTCTPYAIGPIPFMTVHEGDTVVIQSTNPPPISAPTISGYSGCGGSSGSNTPGSPGSSAPASSSKGIQLYLARIAEGESSGGTNLGPNSIGAYGKYQFIPSTRAAILQQYGHDAWNPNQWDQAAIDLIDNVGGQKTLNAINAGDFAYADRVLNGTWTSLPGGAEDHWTATRLAQFGGPNGPAGGGTGGVLVANASGGGSCGGGVQCPPNGPCLLHHPLPNGVITSFFGLRNGRFHWGTDIASTSGNTGAGSAVLSVADGQVVATPDYFGRCGNYGYRIEIDHPGRNLVTTYNHLYRRNVQAGSKVLRGEEIATEGATSCGMYTHLHFETQKTAGIGGGAGAFDPTSLQYQPVLR